MVCKSRISKEGRTEAGRRKVAHDVPREVRYVAFCDLTDVLCLILNSRSGFLQRIIYYLVNMRTSNTSIFSDSGHGECAEAVLARLDMNRLRGRVRQFMFRVSGGRVRAAYLCLTLLQRAVAAFAMGA